MYDGNIFSSAVVSFPFTLIPVLMWTQISQELKKTWRRVGQTGVYKVRFPQPFPIMHCICQLFRPLFLSPHHMQYSCVEHFIYLECSQHVRTPLASKPNYPYTIETLRKRKAASLVYEPKIESEWLWELSDQLVECEKVAGRFLIFFILIIFLGIVYIIEILVKLLEMTFLQREKHFEKNGVAPAALKAISSISGVSSCSCVFTASIQTLNSSHSR